MALIVDILTEEDLRRYANGDLEEDRAEAVEAWLEANPEGQERMMRYHRQRDGLPARAERPVRH